MKSYSAVLELCEDERTDAAILVGPPQGHEVARNSFCTLQRT